MTLAKVKSLVYRHRDKKLNNPALEDNIEEMLGSLSRETLLHGFYSRYGMGSLPAAEKLEDGMEAELKKTGQSIDNGRWILPASSVCVSAFIVGFGGSKMTVCGFVLRIILVCWTCYASRMDREVR